MSESQHVNDILCSFVAIQGYIAGITEFDDQLAPLRLLGKRAADGRGRFQQQELPLDGLCGSPGCFRTFTGQKAPAALQSLACAFRDDYVWHSGKPVSLSVPQVFNHARASCPVKCRPVS